MSDTAIKQVDVYRVRVPLANPYHLSKMYGTLTHSNAVLLRLTLNDGTVGWGEADPGGRNFDGATAESVMDTLKDTTTALPGQCVKQWVEGGRGLDDTGAAAAAIDVACHDALGRAIDLPVYQLLGNRYRNSLDSLWPTSSGSAEADLEVIGDYFASGFCTFMLKMGDKPVHEDIVRVKSVIENLPGNVKIMVDANQGWTREEALTFTEHTGNLPLVLIEQPVAAADLEGLGRVKQSAACPVSVDESIKIPADADVIIAADCADVFSIKISKNGGLANSRLMAEKIRNAGKRVLMNSMIELGITQAASLHLGCTLDNLMDCGHAYMSTLRMADDVSDFSSWVTNGTAHLPDKPGLGVEISLDKVKEYQGDEFHVS